VPKYLDPLSKGIETSFKKIGSLPKSVGRKNET